jgi:hypothetical protein
MVFGIVTLGIYGATYLGLTLVFGVEESRGVLRRVSPYFSGRISR